MPPSQARPCLEPPPMTRRASCPRLRATISPTKHLCYQGPAATIANVLKLDPFSCKPPKDSTVVNGTCAAAGYTDYKLNDPVFREAELWCKAGKHCLL